MEISKLINLQRLVRTKYSDGTVNSIEHLLITNFFFLDMKNQFWILYIVAEL